MLNIDDFLNYISIACWVLLIIYILVVFVRGLLHEGLEIALLYLVSARVLIPLFLTIAVSLVSAAVVFIDPTRVGVVISLISPGGVRPLPLRAGFHLIVPVLEQDVQYSIAWQTYTMSGAPTEGSVSGDDSIRARTSDGQEVRIDSSIIFRVNPDQVVTLHTDWQSRYVEYFVRPMIQGFVRGQVSQFQAREVNSSVRKDLETALERSLRTEFAKEGLLVDRFLLRDITFTKEYAAAVEEKQIALEGEARTEYEAKQMRNLAQGQSDKIAIEAEGRGQQIKTEADARAAATLVEAEAQAKALRLIGAALAENPDLLTHEYIDKLSPSIRVMLVPNNAPLILPLPELSPPLTATEPVTATAPVTPAATSTPLGAAGPVTSGIPVLPSLPVLPDLRDGGDTK